MATTGNRHEHPHHGTPPRTGPAGGHITVGRLGEDLAVDYLQGLGMRIRERNFRCPRGEIDIIAEDADGVVIVEVKTRRSRYTGSPLEAITRVKQRRLRMLAAIWLRAQEEFIPTVRIAALGIVLGDAPRYEYVPDIGGWS